MQKPPAKAGGRVSGIYKFFAEHFLTHGLDKCQLCGTDGIIAASFAQDLQIKETLVVDIAETTHHVHPIHTGTGGEGHLVGILFTVVIHDVQRLEVITGGADEITVGLVGSACGVAQVQVTGVQADAQVLVTGVLDRKSVV